MMNADDIIESPISVAEWYVPRPNASKPQLRRHAQRNYFLS
jgi:hypothetical protein